MKKETLFDIAQRSFHEITPEGVINASGKEEIFGCLFGRDSAETINALLDTLELNPQSLPIDREIILTTCKKTLLELINHQGKTTNPNSNEQPGKFPHEVRFKNYEHLTNKAPNPHAPWENAWYLYDDKVMRSYDSIDSTPLTLLAIYKYSQIDPTFIENPKVKESVILGLNWIITYGDHDKDGLLEYTYDKNNRTTGGLLVQSWTDSHESIKNPDGSMPEYPIAPVEVQAYAWLSLKKWADYFADSSPDFAQKIISQASYIKKGFNNLFIYQDKGFHYLAQALDGTKNQLRIPSVNQLITLAYTHIRYDGTLESIVEKQVIPDIITRSFLPDLYKSGIGPLTMSSEYPTYNPNQDSYHNGSIWLWPYRQWYIALNNFGFTDKASRVQNDFISCLTELGTPSELFTLDELGKIREFKNHSGQTGCKNQAWTLAALIYFLSLPNPEDTKTEFIDHKPLQAVA